VRIERLKYLARTQPDAKPSSEFSTVELAALVPLSEPRLRKQPMLTLADVVHRIALIGGYTGAKSSGGPPGSVVIARGLLELDRFVAIVLEI